MLDHMILTVSNVERSLAFYEAALKPLNIKFFLPYNLIQRPFTGVSWPKTMARSMISTGLQYLLVPGTIFHRGHEWNTTRDTMPPIYLTRTGIHSRWSTKASDGISNRQGAYSTTTVVAYFSEMPSRASER
jgi:hypothetical protein